jgi:hypothetical protein
MSKLGWAWGLVAAAACGGTTATGGDAGRSHDAGHTADAGHDSGASGCPSAMPAAGTACSEATESCEYGDDPQITCDTVMTCDGMAWQKTQSPATTGCSKQNPSGCPATYAAVSGEMGQSCGPMVSCYYAEARCSCEQICLDACIETFDGGPNPNTWFCDVPSTTGCPIPRPRLGTACTGDMQLCDYGGCEGNVTLQCQAGTWLAIQTECPGGHGARGRVISGGRT